MTSKNHKNNTPELSFHAEERERDTVIRDEEHYSRDVDERVRSDDYDIPDFESFNSFKYDVDRLKAPPPLVHPKYGEMQQVWVNVLDRGGSQVHELKAIGYRLRDPSTVPPSFKHLTTSWNNAGVIMVNNDLVLMHIPKVFYLKIKEEHRLRNQQAFKEIRNKHGMVFRDGGIATGERLRNPGKFQDDVVFSRDEYSSGGVNNNVNFAPD